MDLLDFFRGTLPAEAILDYIEHLPSTSAYAAAVADDEELAEQYADTDLPPPGPPRLTEWSPEVQVMAEVRDLLAAAVAVLVKANGGTPRKTKPYPRPVTALQRVRRRVRHLRHNELVKRVLPGRD